MCKKYNNIVVWSTHWSTLKEYTQGVADPVLSTSASEVILQKNNKQFSTESFSADGMDGGEHLLWG